MQGMEFLKNPELMIFYMGALALFTEGLVNIYKKLFGEYLNGASLTVASMLTGGILSAIIGYFSGESVGVMITIGVYMGATASGFYDLVKE